MDESVNGRGTAGLAVRSAVSADTAVACSAPNEVTRRRLSGVLADAGFSVSAVTPSADQLVNACALEPVHMLVVTWKVGALDESADLQLLRARVPEPDIVVVCPANDPRTVRKALAAGADGYICEAEVEAALADTIRAVLAGQVCLPREMREALGRPAFSFREKQVLHLVARGLTNAEIAAQLYLAESTVKSHLSSTFRKLGVSSRKEAAAIVLDPENGLNLEILGGAPQKSARDTALSH